MPNEQSTDILLKLILKSLQAFEKGDFSYRLPTDLPGEAGEIGVTYNRIAGKADLSTDNLRSAGGLAGKKILLVDDDVRSLFAFRSLLELQQMNVMHAEDGEQCLQILEQNPDVDVIMMDIMMPGLSGYEIMAIIRNEYKLLELPIVAVTAKSQHGERERCLAGGATDYLSKPVDGDQLIDVLRSVLKVDTSSNEKPS
jgi:CheY-like chemotaxis protein